MIGNYQLLIVNCQLSIVNLWRDAFQFWGPLSNLPPNREGGFKSPPDAGGFRGVKLAQRETNDKALIGIEVAQFKLGQSTRLAQFNKNRQLRKS